MNTHAFTFPHIPAWYRNAGVIECRECDGVGTIDKTPHLHGNDPDRWEADCEDCEGQGHFACATCGFSTPVAGFDCLVCSTTYELNPAELAAIDPAALAEAFGHALKAAREAV